MVEKIGRIIDKVLSARFLITVAIGYTFCFIVIGATINLLSGHSSIEQFKSILEAVGFSSIVGMVIPFYFLRNDRQQQKEGVTNG